MLNRRVSRSRKDLNTQVPADLDAVLHESINALLGGDPKTDYLKKVCFDKFVSDNTDSADLRRSRAISKWLGVEEDNADTTDRLQTALEKFVFPGLEVSRLMSVAASLIEKVIGEVPPEEVLIGQFTGGATTSRARTESLPGLKFSGKADITEDALHWWEALVELTPGWFNITSISPNVVRGNVLFTVPKSTSIDRVAAKEPDLNMFLQRGVGNYIRKRLKRFGINLNDQSRNRTLAREGSRGGHLATLDLSSASDTVTRELVFQLVPSLWFTLMDDIRSPFTMIDGIEHRNVMFSSMGNGYTFELESLIFWALAKATAYCCGVPGVISVYGDDIIVPSVMAERLVEVLLYAGFKPNMDKSFWTGPFRESCGGHYHNGFDITPFYHRKPLSRLTDLIHVSNQIREWSDSGCGILDSSLYSLWVRLRDMIPRRYWGGHDYSSITQLVTPDYPDRRLILRTHQRDMGVGGYVHWLATTWDREYPGEVETSTSSGSRNVYRDSRAVRPSWHGSPSLFLEEQS